MIRNIFSLFILVGVLMGKGFKVVEDNMKFEMDKRAHFGVSFGLYYTAYTLFDCSDTTAMLIASGIGLSYEIYQGFNHEVHWGFSKEDMIYNIIGIVTANVVHRVWLCFKRIL